MFVMMVGWHVYGKQNLSTETYRTTPEKFTAKAQAMVDKYTVRTETDEQDPGGARRPPGSDVYLIARLWSFWPILELEKDKTYRLHLTSMDYNHGFSLQPANINIQIVPGYRARGDGDAEPVRHLLGGVQRILRHQPSHDGRPHLRQVGEADHGQATTYRTCPRSGLQFEARPRS